MTYLNGIENLNILHQENIPSVEGIFHSPEIAKSESNEIYRVRQNVSEEVNTVREENDTPVVNSLKPSAGYEIPQKLDDEERIVLLFAKMVNKGIPVSQD